MTENINWYPGHMKKTRELIAANLRLVGAVVEVCDARIPVSSRNPIVDELIGRKPRVLVFNKADLADETATKEWLALYGSGRDTEKALASARGAKAGGRVFAVAMNSVTGDGIKKLLAALERTGIARGDHSPKEGATPKGSPRFMVVGVPNSGKSSLINRLTGRKATRTGDRPGVTRGKQWLTLAGGMQLLDTPGILWPKFEDP
ncbi:MAG: ribosome biogenesis GTPase YlqF, partial [Clostridiales Family XIII bacterium]|nr:ribosome biogenesis GTPase YlqF [Clostridiales Family XIII bacterium]